MFRCPWENVSKPSTSSTAIGRTRVAQDRRNLGDLFTNNAAALNIRVALYCSKGPCSLTRVTITSAEARANGYYAIDDHNIVCASEIEGDPFQTIQTGPLGRRQPLSATAKALEFSHPQSQTIECHDKSDEWRSAGALVLTSLSLFSGRTAPRHPFFLPPIHLAGGWLTVYASINDIMQTSFLTSLV